MEFLKKYAALLVLGATIAIGSFGLGYNIGETKSAAGQINLINKTEGQPKDVDFSPFWQAWNIIDEKYVPASTTGEKISDQEKVWGAIKGLADSLGDPYTVFFPPIEAELFESDIRGDFEGVGMEILAQDDVIVVITPLKNSPAERAGILAGDKIIKIDSKETIGLTTEEAVRLIRGPRGTPVTLTIMRNGRREPVDIKIIREVIDIPTISTRMLPNGIFVIELYNFSAKSPNLFRSALREFFLSGSNKLIIDLRGNPGGYLEAAIDMASWFLPPGAVVVREDFGPTEEERVYRSKGYNVFPDDFKLVILVNNGTASAAEILAGALAEHGRAILVGEKTFGKGSVQELISLPAKTSLKITIARWLTPKGSSISDNGIEPNFKVKYTAADREAKRPDPQLEKAIEILSK